jgi:hypothetical protein
LHVQNNCFTIGYNLWLADELLGNVMAAPVDNYQEFERLLSWAKRDCDLFGVMLFDDREKHKTIKKFCVSNFRWLDNLAATNSMILFLPIEEQEIDDPIGFAKKKRAQSDYRNCSLQIASDFDISPNQLPAFLFFTLSRGEMCVEHSATLQFEPGAFAGKAEAAQDFVSDVFSAVSTARRKRQPSELIVKLQSEIDRIKRANQLSPLKKWAKDYVIGLANLPLDISRSLARVGIKKLAGGS